VEPGDDSLEAAPRNVVGRPTTAPGRVPNHCCHEVGLEFHWGLADAAGGETLPEGQAALAIRDRKTKSLDAGVAVLVS